MSFLASWYQGDGLVAQNVGGVLPGLDYFIKHTADNGKSYSLGRTWGATIIELIIGGWLYKGVGGIGKNLRKAILI